MRSGWITILAALLGCSSEPFEFQATISIDDPAAVVTFMGQPLDGRPFELETVFDSFDDGRRSDVRVVVTAGDGEAGEAVIPVGTCRDHCVTECDIGTIVRELMFVSIGPDFTVSTSGTTCWDGRGRTIGYIVSLPEQ